MVWLVVFAIGFALTLPRLSGSRSRLLLFADAFMLAAVSAWLILATLPKAISMGAWWAVAGLAVGVLGSRLLRRRRHPHTPLFLAIVALLGMVCEMVGDDATWRLGWSTAAWRRVVLPAFASLMALGAPALITLLVEEEGRHLSNRSADRWLTMVASMLGLAAASIPATLAPWPTVVPEALSALSTLRTLILEASPGLLLALVLSGLLRAFPSSMPYAWLGKGGPTAQALRGVAVGLPLPICSCGVVPLYRSLIVSGAPPAAALAFLVATPEIGIDAVFLSVPLLGPWLAAARVLAAAIAAIVVGALVGRWIKRTEAPSPVQPQATVTPSIPKIQRLLTLGVEGFREAMDHTAPLVAAGLIVAALVEPLVDPHLLARLPPGLDVPFAGLLGIPIYVCASAATPLVAVLMHKGLSAGAAIAFLLTGPATNLTTFGVLGQLHGKRTAAWFGITVGLCASLLGWGANALGIPGGIPLHTVAEEGPGSAGRICSAVLGLAALATLYRQGIRGIWVGLLGVNHSERHHEHQHHHHHHHHEGCCGRHDHGSGECTCAGQHLGGSSPTQSQRPAHAGKQRLTAIKPNRLILRPASSQERTGDPDRTPE